ncbi:MAG: hypothetical protein U0359_02325 [Byssovorax sp.]
MNYSQILTILPLLLAACATAPPQAPATGETSRLRALGDDLFVTTPSNRYPRGTLFYVLSRDPVPGTTTHPRIGLVHVTEPQPVKAAWYCRPKAPVDADLLGQGLPVESFTPDTTLRVSKCWGHYLGQDAAAWKDQGVVDLRLDLGEGDGVKAKDRFEILGDPHVDQDNRTVTGFDKLGVCEVQPFQGALDRSVCRLDRYTATKFDQQRWVRGGYARLEQP